MGCGLCHTGGVGIDWRAFRWEEDFKRCPVFLLWIDDVVEERRDRNLPAHERVRSRRAGWIEHRFGRSLFFPVVLAKHLPLEHRAGPGRAAGEDEDLSDLLVAVFGLSEIHP